VIPYKYSVFLNVPFDRAYRPLFEAAVFAIFDCGFEARCALEDDDASRVRVDKIYDLISESKYGIHDISRVTLDHAHHLPRFNMPLELGLWLGAKRFGSKRDKQKRALILDKLPYRYQIFCSDIAGQDATSHNNDTATVIRRIRDWLRNSPDYKNVAFPSADTLIARYYRFRAQLPPLCRVRGLNFRSLEFNDYATIVAGWLIVNPR
jgi:hypothetical protein